MNTLRCAKRALAALIPHRADWRAMGWDGLGAALASAALMTLAFPKADLGGLAWVGLAPIFWATRDRPPRAAKWLWYLFGVVWLYASLCWFNTTSYVNLLIYPAIVLMAMILALWMLLFGWGAVWLRRLGPAALALIPLWWITIEYLRTFGELAFPWLFLAHTQHGHPALIQSASLGGTHMLGALIVAGSLLVAEAIRRRGRAVVIGAIIWAALMALNFGLGRHAVARWHQTPGENALRVAVLQPNWPQPTKIAAMSDTRVAAALFDDLLALLGEIEPGSADLVLMPESVLIEYAFPLEGREHLAALGAEARRLRATLIFGANNATLPPTIGIGDATLADLSLHNSVWALNPDGVPAGIYDKVRLVPFSESAPLISLIPGVMELTLGQLALFDPAEEVHPLPVGRGEDTVALGAHVCFESTFPGVVGALVNAGAEVLATVTNDGWFLDSAGPYQHWAVQPFRAVENRRWIACSANTGLSSLVDPAGAVVARAALGERTILRGAVEPLDAVTLCTRHGDWAAQLSLALCALALTLAITRARRQKFLGDSQP